MTAQVIIEGENVSVITAGEIGPKGDKGDIGSKGDKGDQGTQGIPGPAGAVILTYTAGAALGGHRMVILNGAGEAIYADGATLAHANKVLGMTTGAASMGNPATIQTDGPITESTWTWTLDVPVWLGLNGLLTQTAPTSVFSLIIGFPISATQIFIDLREPLFLT